MQEITNGRGPWQVVGRPTSEDGWVKIPNPNTVTGLYTNFAEANAAAQAATGVPDNYFETRVLGDGPTYQD